MRLSSRAQIEAVVVTDERTIVVVVTAGENTPVVTEASVSNRW